MRQGSNLQVAYFDQMRGALNLDATLDDTINPGSEWIEIGNQRKHVMSYLGDFLFSPERANSPVRSLSGGERNRLLLARLFARPANVLVLDEPTNDLDIDTLDLLEDLLQYYDGTVFLVSHDRRFLDNVVTSTIAWEGDGFVAGPGCGASTKAATKTGSCSANARGPWPLQPRRRRRPQADLRPPQPHRRRRARTKLSYKEQRELDALPARIEALEVEQKALAAHLASGELYVKERQLVPALQARLQLVEAELLQALERWELLASR